MKGVESWQIKQETTQIDFKKNMKLLIILGFVLIGVSIYLSTQSDEAKKYSDDTASAKKGGDLGYFNSEDMDGGFYNGAKSLNKGQYSKEPVESSYGYHIILKTGEKKKKSLI